MLDVETGEELKTIATDVRGVVEALDLCGDSLFVRASGALHGLGLLGSPHEHVARLAPKLDVARLARRGRRCGGSHRDGGDDDDDDGIDDAPHHGLPPTLALSAPRGIGDGEDAEASAPHTVFLVAQGVVLTFCKTDGRGSAVDAATSRKLFDFEARLVVLRNRIVMNRDQTLLAGFERDRPFVVFVCLRTGATLHTVRVPSALHEAATYVCFDEHEERMLIGTRTGAVHVIG